MKKIVFLVLAAVFLCSCEGLGTKGNEEQVPFAISFRADQWGIGYSFKEGDRIGLFAYGSLECRNNLLTVNGDGSVSSGNTLKWDTSSEDKKDVALVAYMPWSESFASGEGNFSVRADQTSDAEVRASDFLLGTMSVKFLAKTADISLGHKMVRLAVYVDNQTGKKIESVYVKGVCGEAGIDFREGSVKASASGKTVSVKAGEYKAASGASYYAAIVPPQKQSATIVISIRLEGENEQEFTPINISELGSGQQWDNFKSPIRLGQDTPVQTEIEFSISDWDEGSPLDYKRK